jgi:hypothetical protein
MRSRDATEPRPVSLTMSRASGLSRRTVSTVSSVQPSAVIKISSDAGFSARNTASVRRKSAARFFVVIITENVMQ